MKKLLVSIVCVCIGLAATYFGGYAFATLWGWFIVKQFGLAAISTSTGIGVLFVVALPTCQHAISNYFLDEDRVNKMLDSMGLDQDSAGLVKAISGFLAYAFVLLGGFIWHWFLA